MRLSSVIFFTILLFVIVSLVCIWLIPSAQDFLAGNTMWNGLRDFRRESKAEIIESMAQIPESVDKVSLISIPYLPYDDEEMALMKNFIGKGGTLLLLDDYGYGNDLLAYLDLETRFTNKSLLDPLFCYRNQWLPKITDFAPDLAEAGIETVVLNHATTLMNVSEEYVIARSSIDSFLDSNDNDAWDEGEPEGPLPVAARIPYGGGMLILISDPSIAINSMVARENNYNFVRLLTTPYGNPKGVLLEYAHLSQMPLDASKHRLSDVRTVMSTPYCLLGIVLLIFLIASRYILDTGGGNGSKEPAF